jgi:hypothetical protein
VKFVSEEFDDTATGFIEAFTATGIAGQTRLNSIAESAVKPLIGLESYFGNINADANFSPEDEARVAVTTQLHASCSPRGLHTPQQRTCGRCGNSGAEDVSYEEIVFVQRHPPYLA